MTFYIALMFTIVVIWIATLAYCLRRSQNEYNFLIRKLETKYPDMEKELRYVTYELEELKIACNKWAESPTTGNEQKIKKLLKS